MEVDTGMLSEPFASLESLVYRRMIHYLMWEMICSYNVYVVGTSASFTMIYGKPTGRFRHFLWIIYPGLYIDSRLGDSSFSLWK